MATLTASRVPASDEGLVPYRWIVLVGLITAAILEVLDTTIVNVSLPQMAGNLGATFEEIGWVSTGYILSNVVVLPMTAWLSSRFGRKRYLIGSISLFLLASFFCGASRGLSTLVFWRIVQGAGGAALLSTSQATLREIFPREQQGVVQSIYILGIIVAPTLGPTLGGYITDNYSWPWIFYVNIPIGLTSVIIVALFLSDAKYNVPSTRIDFLGIALLAIGLGSLQYVLEQGKTEDWFQSALIVRLSIIAAVALISLILWEISPRNRQPVVNFRILKNKQFSASLILFMALGFGLYGGIFIFPLFAQNILGFTSTVTGLVLLPGGIATGIGALVCGRLLNGPKALVNPRVLILFGLALFALSMWDLGHLTTVSGEMDTRFSLIVRGLGLGFLFTPINIAAFNSLSGPEIAQGSGLINLMRQMGGSFGIAYLSTYVTNRTDIHRNMLATYLYPENPLFAQRLNLISHRFMTHGYDAHAAQKAAMGLIDRTVTLQAMTMSYNDAFLLIGYCVVLVSPAVFLLRTGKKADAASAAADMH